MTKIEEKKKPEKENNRDINLVKIQIYSDRIHAIFASLLAFVLALFVGLSILFTTVLYENLGPSPIITYGVGIIGTLIFAFISIPYLSKNYYKNYKKISEKLEEIKEGKDLETLEKLSE